MWQICGQCIIYFMKKVFFSIFSKKEVFLWIKVVHVTAIRIRNNPRAAPVVLWGPKATRDRQVLKVSKGMSVVRALRETEGNRGRLGHRVFPAFQVQEVPEEIRVR